MQKTVIVSWSDMAGTAAVQTRLDELNAQGYEVRFYGKAATETTPYNTVILVKEESRMVTE